MDKDRVKGSAQQAKGAVKEAAGKVTGAAKLQAEGKADKTAGKIRNAIGGLKDTLRGKLEVLGLTTSSPFFGGGRPAKSAAPSASPMRNVPHWQAAGSGTAGLQPLGGIPRYRAQGDRS
jgi:uncharacterized protein YjbJ (UPF0337 family)